MEKEVIIIKIRGYEAGEVMAIVGDLRRKEETTLDAMEVSQFHENFAPEAPKNRKKLVDNPRDNQKTKVMMPNRRKWIHFDSTDEATAFTGQPYEYIKELLIKSKGLEVEHGGIKYMYEDDLGYLRGYGHGRAKEGISC